jgi:hypothetical protein
MPDSVILTSLYPSNVYGAAPISVWNHAQRCTTRSGIRPRSELLEFSLR